MTEELQKKVDRAIKLLQSTCKDQQVELCYSGGKDSDVNIRVGKNGRNQLSSDIQEYDY